MWKLSDLIGDYEEPETIKVSGLNKEVPIDQPEKLDWNYLENPNRLVKIVQFNAEEKFNSFIIDVLEHQAETGHHGRITIQYPQIKLEVWTHTLNDITEVDFEWAKTVSEIFEGYNE